jgi:uncharacterized protein (TIGR03437 family)
MRGAIRDFLPIALLLLVALEGRAQGILGGNLIQNPGAEAGSAGTDLTHAVTTIPNWTRAGTGLTTVVPYTITNYLLSSDPAPANRGFQYFAGAGYPNPVTLSQDIDVSSAVSAIGTGKVKYTLSGYLGASNPSDYHGSVTISAAFKNASGQTFTTGTLGPASYPGNGITFQQMMGLVPSGTLRITVTLSFAGLNGGNGAADDLSLVLTNLDTSPGTVLGHNLVVNPGAEIGPNAVHTAVAAYIPGWTTPTGSSVAPYGGTGWIAPTDPGAPDRGVSVFCGLPGLINSTMYQDIDVSAAAALIDAGSVKYEVSAWLGRVGGNPPASLKYTFFDWSDTPKQLAPTALLQFASPPGGSVMTEESHSDILPAGTRRVRIELDFSGPGGGNGSVADNVAFALATPSGPPVITPAGIVSASAFGGFTTIAPGSWVEIYGLNLAANTANWAPKDFVNGVGPTSLGNVSVSIGGKPAFIDFVSPGQVNALIPSDAPTGVVPITLTNPNGVSDNFFITVNPTAPGLLAPPIFTVAGKQYLAALLPDNQTFALPVNAIAGVPSRPAKPGESLTIFGVGFGPVTGGFTAGTIVTDLNALTTQFQLQLGSVAVTPAYAGLAPSFTGLYQFNVTVPIMNANAAVPVGFTLGGTKGTQTLYIAVGN